MATVEERFGIEIAEDALAKIRRVSDLHHLVQQLAAAKAEIDAEANRAREELRGKVSAVALAGAEKILNREIDAKEHEDILGKLAQEL